MRQSSEAASAWWWSAGVPSPWGEAAKGILHVKNIEWAAVRLVYDSEPLKEWGMPGRNQLESV